jgi:hypothetical protein
MDQLREFWGLNWIENCPQVFLVDEHKTIDILKGEQTQNWVVGWANGMNIFLLNPANYGAETVNKYSDENMEQLIKHELCHLFFTVTAGFNKNPLWLNEGISLYFSGQVKSQVKPGKLENFLDYYSTTNGDVYKEPGWVVDLLVKKFGREKLIQLVKSLEKVNSPEDFDDIFQKIYGFEMGYEKINEMYVC